MNHSPSPSWFVKTTNSDYGPEEESRTHAPAGWYRHCEFLQWRNHPAVCLFFIEPLGEIASSAVSIVSELLVLCGAILGVKASYDVKFRKFEAELRDVREHETQPTT